MRIPDSTYRVQANSGFTFGQVKGVVEYLKSLGIGDLYCSPILAARHGSVHCYDVTDHKMINPQLGGEEGLSALISALKSAGMGLVLDIVPNHMSASSDNPYWMDVLEWGRASPASRMFDVDWDPPVRGLHNKILLPKLEGPLKEAIASGTVKLTLGKGPRPLVVMAGGSELPLSPQTYLRIGSFLSAAARARGEGRGLASFLALFPKKNKGIGRPAFERTKKAIAARLSSDAELRAWVLRTLAEPVPLRETLGDQHYVLCGWREAETKVNYRRFLNVNELVALRVEDLRVFRMTHQTVLELLRTGRAQGIRVDHADGLRDPSLYFRRLRAELGKSLAGNSYVVAEKVLQPGRRLPAEWEVSGTTGYGFMNELNRLYVKTENEGRFDEIYRKFSGNRESFEESVYRGKIITARSMRSELRTLTRLLNTAYPLSGAVDLEAAIREVAARFEGYRVYISPRSRRVRGRWRKRIETAVRRARVRGVDRRSLEVVRDALLLTRRPLQPERAAASTEFVLRFQQFTTAVAVKGEEDTALYRYNRLTSLNEVGGDPTMFGGSIADFHRANRERLNSWPHAMVSTSTHDTKRSEDVRARLNVLSELPDEWEQAIRRWRQLTSRMEEGGRRRALSGNDEYLFYQTLLGAWPHHPPGDYAEFVRRMVSYMKKATKEERRETSWTQPSPCYDASVEGYVRSAMARPGRNRFLADFLIFEEKVDWFGMLNSLSQTMIKLTAPGVPDTYQGNELWDYSLVDPDNRRPVDFALRRKMLRRTDEVLIRGGKAAAARSALEDLPSGSAKLYLTAAVLRYRSANQGLFREGEYVPLAATGPRRSNILSFARTLGDRRCVVFAPRFFTQLCDQGSLPLGRAAWGDTLVATPDGVEGCEEVLTGRKLTVEHRRGRPMLAVADALAWFPVALVNLV